MDNKLIIAFIGIVSSTLAHAADAFIYAVGVSYGFDRSIDIAENSIVTAESLYSENSITIKNFANITSADFHICDGCDLNIYNYGNIGSVFSGNTNSNLIQIIDSEESLGSISVDDDLNYSVKVTGNNNIKTSEIMGNVTNADKLILKDTSLFMDVVLDLKNIIIEGNLTLNMDEQKDGIIVKNVSLSGADIDINVLNLNPLYTAESVVQDGNLVLNIVRETDYKKVLGVTTGSVLNSMRTSNVNAGFINAMDNASCTTEMNSIMAKSVLFNPLNLLNPLKTFNNNMVLGFKDYKEKDDFEMDANYIMSDDINMNILNAKSFLNFGNFSIGLSGHFGSFKNSDEYNDYVGDIYGGALHLGYKHDTNWFDGVIGYNYAKYETDGVFNSGDLILNVAADSVYMSGDFGFVSFKSGNVDLHPFIGSGFNRYSILNNNEQDVYARAGINLKYEKQYGGAINKYESFLILQTNNIYSFGVKHNYFSVADKFGVNFMYAADYMPHNKIGHRFNFGANTVF